MKQREQGFFQDIASMIKTVEQSRGKEEAAELSYWILQYLAATQGEKINLTYRFFDRLNDKITKLEEMTDYANNKI